MKTFLIVLLFVSSYTYAAAPPSINNPAPFIICDEYNDGFGVFDIFTRNSEILGSLNPANFTVSYHSTLADAQNNSNIISVSETTYYTNTLAFAETIGVRVTDNTTNEYATTTMDLGFTPAPTIITPPNIYQFNPSGTAIFDLSSQNSLFLSGQTASTVVEYYPTYNDALALTNEITNQTSYTNVTNPQQMWARLNNLSTACYSIMSFNLIVNTNTPTINNPSPLAVCDFNSNGFANFNLNIVKNQTLTVLTHVLSFHYTSSDAQNNANPIPETNYANYINANPYNETLYIRVIDPNFPTEPAFTTVDLHVNFQIIPIFTIPNTVCENAVNIPLPVISTNGITGTWSPAVITSAPVTYIFTPDPGLCATPATVTISIIPAPTANPPANMIVNDNPFDGFAVFDLTLQSNAITQGSGSSVTYFPSLLEAQSDVNAITNPSAYVNTTNPQTIGVRVTDPVTGCFNFTTFDLILTSNSFPINSPTPYELCGNTLFTFDLSTKNNEILGALSPSDYMVNYFETLSDAQTGANILPAIYQPLFPNIQTLYVRVIQISTNLFSITTLDLIMNPAPQIPNPIPNLTVYENPFDSVAIFNLGIHTPLLANGNLSITVTYYTTQVNANAQSNPISNTTFYNGIDGQVIWVNVQNSATGCFTIGSFMLRVVDSSLVVYIPDLNFKAKLITEGVDTNSDGEIQFTEAVIPTTLVVANAAITDLTGIEAFTNLQSLNCSNNQLTSLNVNSLINLNYLSFNFNLISSINLTNLVSLNYLYCQNNQLQTLNVSGLDMYWIDCSGNQLTALDVSGMNNMSTLRCNNNLLTSLNVSNLATLGFIDCSNNALTSLTATNITASSLYCQNNNLTNLNVSNASISQINCANNQLATIDLATTNISFELNCSNNQLASLDVTGKLFGNFLCSNNLLTTLDVSTCTALTILQCDTNPLTSLFVKNGRNESITFSGNANLNFICADESQISMLQAMANAATVVSSFCTFTPGGNYNTITGTVRVDANNNGCDAADLVVPYYGSNLSYNGISTNSTIFSNAVGVYNLYTSIDGTYQLEPLLENATYFNVAPVATTIPTIDNTTTTLNICLTPNGVHPDVEVILAPITPARPGFNASYEIVYKNKGNQTLSGAVTFNYTDTILDFVTATVAPTTQSTGVITWNYTNLQPFENRAIGLTLNVNSPVETPAVVIGDILNYTVSITPVSGDEMPADNEFNYLQTVVGSYDPNDIACLQGAIVSPSEIGNYLHYIINFENTGNFYAENVVVQEMIDTAKFDIASLQILNASHAMVPRINGNKVEFVFENINLAEAAGNPPVGGHGNVLFKIKSKDNLVANDFVEKTAKIFFDYNAPIATNIAQTTFQLLNNSIFEFDNSLKIAPNPTSSIIAIESEFAIQSYELYDVQGRILEKSFENSTSTTLDVSARQNGIYFLKITTERGSKVEKIVKK